jgi:hypothetical protein
VGTGDVSADASSSTASLCNWAPSALASQVGEMHTSSTLLSASPYFVKEMDNFVRKMNYVYVCCVLQHQNFP